MRKLILAVLGVLLMTTGSYAQGIPYQLDPPAPNAILRACSFPVTGGNPCSNPATIYSDSALTQAIAQPVQLGDSGNLIFYYSSGPLMLQLTGSVNRSILVAGGGGGTPGGGSAAIFNFSTSCVGLSNCFKGTADDSTDNCGTALTAWLASINAYNGSGTPQVWIAGGPDNVYKLAAASCHLEFDIPVSVHLWGSLDCAQTAVNCIQFGQSGLAAQAYVPKSTLDGGGSLLGGASLTMAGIEMEPYNTNTVITGISFHNFGAGHAAGSVCTNRAIVFDPNVFEGTVAFTQWDITDSTVGRCAYFNNGALGENTVFFDHNTLGGASGTGIPPTTCSNVGIEEGGYYGSPSDNNVYGFAVDVLLEGVGTREVNNTLDSAGCANGTLKAPIQWGANSATTTVQGNLISGDNLEGAATHNTYLLAKNPNTNAGSSLQDMTLIGNQASNSGGSSPALTDGSPCTISSVNNGTACYALGNVAIVPPTPGNNWCVGIQCGQFYAASQSANIGSTSVGVVPTATEYIGTCQIVLTRVPTTSGTLPSCTFSWTDLTSNTTQTQQIVPAYPSGSAAPAGCQGNAVSPPALGNSCQGSVVMFPKAGTNVNVSTSGYVSSGATSQQYQILAEFTRNIQ